MQLWTDYEGVTIDGAFPLHKLLLPEGRSAFFSTAGPKGEPTVVRLIECHFDEEEILARWRCMEALNHPNFLKFEHYGQIRLDDGPVVYVVVERVDANLAEVLDQGRLTVKDVAQLASSLISALDVLHTHGFIHEHIEPRNIFAVGDVVKLRSDCIREAPENGEGRAAKQRDVSDLVTVLLQALTQQQSIAGISDSAVPPPFGQIIRNGLDGTWGLKMIRAALEDEFGRESGPAKESANAAPVTRAMIEKKAPSPVAEPPAQLPLPLADEDREAQFSDMIARKNAWGEERRFSLRSRWVGAAGIVAVALLSTWGVVHAWNTRRHEATHAAAPISQPAVRPPQQISKGSSHAAVAPPSPPVSHPLSVSSRSGWRVIAFTYNHKADAEKKVSSLALSHPDLQPVVFTPNGHAPYLVSIGGVMDRDAAYAFARRSRSQGLPHDIYAQNYSH